MKVGIVGAGSIGRKRVEACLKSNDDIRFICDINNKKAKELARLCECKTIFNNHKEAIKKGGAEVIIVSTTHDMLAQVSLEALRAKKHVLCEKPLGIRSKEVEKCLLASQKENLVYKAGYNHRFHPAIKKAYSLYNKGVIGRIMYIKASYGHGGRPGYEKEWRFNRSKSGGGELIDQGAHLIDLALWFTNEDITKVLSQLQNAFWKTKVEDNAFLTLVTKNTTAFLHASWTQWKNNFVLEIYGQKGYLRIKGLGGSYGTETLTFGKRNPGKAPIEKSWRYPDKDESWNEEWKNFKKSLNLKDNIGASGKDGLKTMRIIEVIYEDSNNKG